MSTQSWPGHSFCKSAYINAVHYPGCRLGGGGSSAFWQFLWVLCRSKLPEAVKNLLYIPH